MYIGVLGLLLATVTAFSHFEIHWTSSWSYLAYSLMLVFMIVAPPLLYYPFATYVIVEQDSQCDIPSARVL